MVCRRPPAWLSRGRELVGGCIMHDGEPTSSLPWDAARKSITITQVKTRIESKCAKCGALNRVAAAQGQVRVPYKCKECGEEQRTF